eukprot:CAMPEP_0173450854 /NCGR_PEP_ID=MMETSP1357-20121228/45582_1 /TAXON_ID=77926 /ORGANISM="Hemiselmis rufescens, Strain PCC563" /LENGTH=49 /DNA_ID=CAMNT_0014417563 /DNA_START=78 /DNA_END=227 /DNA_ORIENTATION=+
MCEDGSAAFDLPSELATQLVEGNKDGFTFATKMPKIARKPPKDKGAPKR